MRSACRYLISGEGAFSQAGELTLAFRLQWRRAGGHHAPSGLKVGLMGVAPNRSGPGATETAVASAKLDTAITHADGSLAKGGSLEFGAPEFERQLVLGLGVFENFAGVEFLGSTGTLTHSVKFNGDEFNPSWSIDPVSTDVKLGSLLKGDTLSYVYTLTAQSTTHGACMATLLFWAIPSAPTPWWII